MVIGGPNDCAYVIESLKASSFSSLRLGAGDSSSGKEIFWRPPWPAGPLENAGVNAICPGLVKELLLVLSICKKFALPVLALLDKAGSKPSSAYSPSLKEASFAA